MRSHVMKIMSCVGQADNMKMLLKETTQLSWLVACNDALPQLVFTFPG
jgi:hypothetical protein